MTSGVYDRPFTRWHCHQEMATARSEGLPVSGVMEVEDRLNSATLRRRIIEQWPEG
jgi:hypothetical protein